MEPVSAAIFGLAAKYLPDVIDLFSDDKKANKTAKVVSKIAQEVTGASTLVDIDKALNDSPQLVFELRKAIMANEHVAEQMRLADVANARDMQKTALGQDDIFSKRFIYYYATGWTIFAFCYLTGITFFELPASAVRYADTVLGFILGTGLGAFLQFFYGSNIRSKGKDDAIRELTKQRG